MRDLLDIEMLDQLEAWQAEADDEVSDLIEDLHSDELNERLDASQRVAAKGPQGRSAILALIETQSWASPRPGNDRAKLTRWAAANRRQRRKALDALVVIGDAAVAPLGALIDAGADDARESLVHALERVKDPQAIQSLASVLRDAATGPARRAAANAIATLGGDASVAALTSGMHDDDELVALTCARILADSGTPQAVHALIDALSDKDSPAHDVATELGDVSNPAATATLIAALGSETTEVVALSSQALGNIGGPDVRGPLVGLLVHPARSVRSAARAALEGDGSWRESAEARAVVPQLLEALGADDPRLRSDAADLLGLLSAQDAADALIARLADADAKVRGYAASSLRRLQVASAIDPLLKAIATEPELFAVNRIAAALGSFGEVRAVEPLIALLDPERRPVQTWNRSGVVHALADLGDRRAVSAVVYVLNNRGSGISESTAAVDALAILGGDEAKEALLRVQESHWSDNTRAATMVGRRASEALKGLVFSSL